ncbi:MAG: hypothetical protein ACTHN5_01710 [Phycisphaerae bacterium]
MAREQYLQSLQDHIFQKHGCRAAHFQTVPLHEKFHGKTIFDGNIEVFTLLAHPTASRCFAWCHEDDPDCVSYLALPPILTPSDAMRQHIIDEFTGHA